MITDKPAFADLPALRRLWQMTFGDTDPFLDSFFGVGFSFDRCRCIKKEDRVIAALYWFDCSLGEKKLAYLYAVATEETLRKQGFGRALLEDTHRQLKVLGYAGVVLVPVSEDVRQYYRRFGYENFGGVDTVGISLDSAEEIDQQEYARLRRQYLPAGSVVQEGVLLDFFAAFAKFYAGDGFLLAVTEDGGELLGNISGAASGNHYVRTPGNTPFAMYLPLTDKAETPTYFGIALD